MAERAGPSGGRSDFPAMPDILSALLAALLEVSRSKGFAMSSERQWTRWHIPSAALRIVDACCASRLCHPEGRSGEADAETGVDEQGGARDGPGYLGADSGMHCQDGGDAIASAELEAPRVGRMAGDRLIDIDVGDDCRRGLPGQREARADGNVVAQEPLVGALAMRPGFERGVQVQEERHQAKRQALGRVSLQLDIHGASCGI